MRAALIVAVWIAVSLPVAIAVAVVIRIASGMPLSDEIERYLRRLGVAPLHRVARHRFRMAATTVTVVAAVVGSIGLVSNIPGGSVVAGLQRELFGRASARASVAVEPRRTPIDAAARLLDELATPPAVALEPEIVPVEPPAHAGSVEPPALAPPTPVIAAGHAGAGDEPPDLPPPIVVSPEPSPPAETPPANPPRQADEPAADDGGGGGAEDSDEGLIAQLTDDVAVPPEVAPVPEPAASARRARGAVGGGNGPPEHAAAPVHVGHGKDHDRGSGH